MGRRSGVATVGAILEAFDAQKSWRQPDLARHVGVSVPALRKHLAELVHVLPLDERRTGQDVAWELPRGWTASGLLVPQATVASVIRLLARSPRSKLREEVLTALLRKSPNMPRNLGVATASLSETEERVLPILEDAAARHVVVTMRYVSASRGGEQSRRVSVARVLPGPPVRFVGHCHLTGEMRRFRAEGVRGVSLAPEERFVAVPDADVDAFVAQAVGGYAEREGPRECAFVVRAPEARWVRQNLTDGMRAADLPGGALRVLADGRALRAVARYVAGLGEAARAETAELRAEVRAIAEGALRASEP